MLLGEKHHAVYSKEPIGIFPGTNEMVGDCLVTKFWGPKQEQLLLKFYLVGYPLDETLGVRALPVTQVQCNTYCIFWCPLKMRFQRICLDLSEQFSLLLSVCHHLEETRSPL